MDDKFKLYNLTFPQKNIWQLNMISEGSPINVIAGSVNISEGFDKTLANDTLNELVRLNDGLRLHLILVDGNVFQKVSDYERFEASYIDASNYTQEQIIQLKKDIILRPMQVIDSNLFEYTLIDEGSGKGQIFLKAHHIIADAWSTAKMSSQISHIYEALSKGQEYANGKYVSSSYTDFILSEKEYIESAKYIKDGEFWQNYLDGFNKVIGFNKPNTSNTFEAKRYEYVLNDAKCSKISDFCKQNRFSPYIVFMAAFGIYLSYINSVQDVVIGTPVLNRSNVKEKAMQGMCISTIPIRIKTNSSSTFYSVCKSIAKDSFDTFKHQKYPYSEISKEYKLNSQNTDNLFKTMVSYQNARADFADNNKYSMSWMFQGSIEEELDLHIQDLNNSGNLILNVDYKTELFTDYEIELLVKRLENIILNGIVNAYKPLKELDFICEEEKNIISKSQIGEVSEYPNNACLIQLFLEQVEKTPDKIALVYNNQSVTYSMLNIIATGIQAVLQSHNVAIGDYVGIMQDKGIYIVASILAVLRCGAKYVPMDKKASRELKEYIANNSNLKLVITDDKSIKLDVPCVDISGMESNMQSKTYDAVFTAPDEVVNVMYTSGTTGRPKGVEITNKNIIRLVKNSNYLNLNSEDIMTQTGSYTFDASTLEIWNGLLNGVTLHILDTYHLAPDYFAKYINNNKITVIFLTTALFNQMIEYNAAMFKNIRLVMTGGEAMSLNHVKRLKQACPDLHVLNLYGPTENSVVSTYYEVTGEEEILPIGKPLSNTTCYVLNDNMLLQPLYVTGTLYVGGDGVAKGYINDKEKTSQKFINGLYSTGDLVYIDENSNINFIGRKDKEVKIKGVRIDLKDARQKLLEMPGIKNCEFVLNIDSKNSANKHIVVFYVPHFDIAEENVIEYIKQFMPYMVAPKKAIKLKEFPLTLNGKIDTKELLKIYENMASTRSDKLNNIPEYNGVYKTLYEIFSKVLKDKNILPTDDFFELGGDSLSGIQVVTECMARDIHLSYGELFKYKTIQDIGDILEKKKIKAEISTGIEDYDYSDVHKVISLNVYDNIKNIKTQEMGDVILTGATGFLGAHILYELVTKTKSTVFCPVRIKEGIDVALRLKSILNFYFKDKLDNFLGARIRPFACDLTEENNNMQDIFKLEGFNITHCIHSAATVKHYGDLTKFKKVNVHAVMHLCNMCSDFGVELIHISTGSVSGDIVENAQNITSEGKTNKVKKAFSETDLYIGQQLDNVYAYSKFLAERYVLEQISQGKLKAKVLRMGNLSHRYSDYVFQINPNDNAFLMRLKSFVSLGAVPCAIKDYEVDFTPVDLAALAVINVSKIANKEANVYHLYNPNKTKISKLVTAFEMCGVSMIYAEDEQIKSRITKMLNVSSSTLKGIVMDVTEDKKLNYVTDVDVKLDYSEKVLEAIGFIWPDIDDKYLKKYIEYLLKN